MECLTVSGLWSPVVTEDPAEGHKAEMFWSDNKKIRVARVLISLGFSLLHFGSRLLVPETPAHQLVTASRLVSLWCWGRHYEQTWCECDSCTYNTSVS